MANETNRLTNCSVYVNGTSFLGKAEEVDLPKLVATMSAHKVLGFLGQREYPSGFEKMELRIKWNSCYPEVLSAFGNMYAPVKIMIRASMEVWAGGGRTRQIPVIGYAICQSKGLPLPNFKPNEGSEQESMLACTYFKLEIDGVNKVEFDAEANIYSVDGVDLLQQYRINIGQ